MSVRFGKLWCDKFLLLLNPKNTFHSKFSLVCCIISKLASWASNIRNVFSGNIMTWLILVTYSKLPLIYCIHIKFENVNLKFTIFYRIIILDWFSFFSFCLFEIYPMSAMLKWKSRVTINQIQFSIKISVSVNRS